MMFIGICDDRSDEREYIRSICYHYFIAQGKQWNCQLFSSGEELVAYCDHPESVKLDLLFLDVEMGGVSGVEIIDWILRCPKIWRLLYVSNYDRYMSKAFSLKTMGYLIKPVHAEEIQKKIDIVRREKQKNVILVIDDHYRDNINVRLNDVLYLKADGSNTEVITYESIKRREPLVVVKKLGEMEEKLKQYPFLRIHKSYLVNLLNVAAVRGEVFLRNMTETLPIGRTYREQVHQIYMQYCKDTIKERI